MDCFATLAIRRYNFLALIENHYYFIIEGDAYELRKLYY